MSQQNGKSWDKISECVDGRDENDCFSRWHDKLRPILHRAHWDVEDDALLDEAVTQFGIGNWEEIAETVGNHTADQCMLKYYEKLNPELGKGSKGAWTNEEDERLRNAVELYKAKDWKKIAQ